MGDAPRHQLAVDMTEHFQNGPGGRAVHARHWHRFPAHLAANAETILEVFRRTGTQATFFVDGWTARRESAVISKIAGEGHEIGLLYRGAEDIADDHTVVVAASGQAVAGCRIAPGAEDAFDASKAKSVGLRYVVASDRPAGVDGTKDTLLFMRAGAYMSTSEWLRLLPRRGVAPLLDRWVQRTKPGLFVVNLWEIDESVQRLALHKGLSRVRAYRNTEWLAARLTRFLGSVRFAPLGGALGIELRRAEVPAFAPAERERVHETTSPGLPISVVIPCFNEEDGMAYLGNALGDLDRGLGCRHRLDFVLVDDGSTDGTWREMRRLFKDDPRFTLVQHRENRGIGAAILTGTRAAKNEIVAVMDSDCSYDPARIEDMLDLLEPDVALVTASPYHPKGGVDGVPAWRLMLSRGASWGYGLLLNNKLATYTSCFRVFRKQPVSALELRQEGYIGVVEMLARLDQQGWRIAECPIVLETRLLGKSKLRLVGTIAGHLKFMSEILMWKRAVPKRHGQINVVE